MKFTVDQIADLIEGTVNGNGATLISNFDKIEENRDIKQILSDHQKLNHLLNMDLTKVMLLLML